MQSVTSGFDQQLDFRLWSCINREVLTRWWSFSTRKLRILHPYTDGVNLLLTIVGALGLLARGTTDRRHGIVMLGSRLSLHAHIAPPGC
jgi:hypothetical protein